MVRDNTFRMRSPELEGQTGQARIAVIGSKAVGKTALTVRYLTKRFIGEYQSNTNMIYKATMPIDGTNISVEILDLSSNLDEVIVPRETITWAEAWLVVYSITSRESYQVATRAVEAVTSSYGSETTSPPVLIMANKTDLEHYRKVSENEGRQLADQYSCRFVEVSAAEMVTQVNDSIDGLLRQVPQMKGHTSPRLRKLSVSKMFNQLINRNSNATSSTSSSPPNCTPVPNNLSNSGITSSIDKIVIPRMSFRDRNRKRSYIRQT